MSVGRLQLFGKSDWHLVPNPLGCFGNTTTPLLGGGGDALSMSPPSGGISSIGAGGQTGRLIHPEEFVLASEMLRSSDNSGSWEVLSDNRKAGVVMKRLVGEPLNGPLTIIIEGRLPGMPLEVVASTLSKFSEREWDGQQRDFSLHDEWGCPESHANGLTYFVLHVPPFTDRDFCNLTAVAKADDGSAYITITRQTEHSKFPVGMHGRIRADLFVNITYTYRDPQDPKSTCFKMITKQDVKLIIPFWVINFFFPSEMTKWKLRLQKACEGKMKQLRSGGRDLTLPLADFFSSIARDDADGKKEKDLQEMQNLAANIRTGTVIDECDTVVYPPGPKIDRGAGDGPKMPSSRCQFLACLCPASSGFGTE